MRKKIKEVQPKPMANLTSAEVNFYYQLSRLDAKAANFECKYGIGALERILQSRFRDLWDKWQVQCSKLNKCIDDKDVSPLIDDMVAGSIRAYDLFDEKFRAAGIPHHDPNVWFVGLHTGKTYVVCHGHFDAQAAKALQKDDMEIVTVEELLNVWAARHEKVYGGDKVTPQPTSGLTKKNKEVFKSGGDALPF